jgi:glucose-6-phosphate isomerase
MFPLALLGVDVRALRTGAADMFRTCTNFDSAMNPAVMTAVLQHEALLAGFQSHTFFAFADELESLGKWWRQLVGESLAKTVTNGKERVGVIPTVSIGSTDLHSVGQLYLGGPKTTLTTFVSVRQESKVVVPKVPQRLFPETVPVVSGVSPERITAAIIGGTKRAYEQAELPYISIEFPALTSYELGAFMQYAMCSTIYTASLLNVNAFNQPEVELYKVETKRLLQQDVKS